MLTCGLLGYSNSSETLRTQLPMGAIRCYGPLERWFELQRKLLYTLSPSG